LVAAFKAGGIDLPVDHEHQNDNPDARLNGPVPAAGRITQLRAGAGLWGRVASTATAAEMIGNREYRFLSPKLPVPRRNPPDRQAQGRGPGSQPQPAPERPCR